MTGDRLRYGVCHKIYIYVSMRDCEIPHGSRVRHPPFINGSPSIYTEQLLLCHRLPLPVKAECLQYSQPQNIRSEGRITGFTLLFVFSQEILLTKHDTCRICHPQTAKVIFVLSDRPLFARPSLCLSKQAYSQIHITTAPTAL